MRGSDRHVVQWRVQGHCSDVVDLSLSVHEQQVHLGSSVRLDPQHQLDSDGYVTQAGEMIMCISVAR